MLTLAVTDRPFVYAVKKGPVELFKIETRDEAFEIASVNNGETPQYKVVLRNSSPEVGLLAHIKTLWTDIVYKGKRIKRIDTLSFMMLVAEEPARFAEEFEWFEINIDLIDYRT
jgi:hypothetical protein